VAVGLEEAAPARAAGALDAALFTDVEWFGIGGRARTPIVGRWARSTSSSSSPDHALAQQRSAVNGPERICLTSALCHGMPSGASGSAHEQIAVGAL